MAINKVVYDGNTLIDLTSDTVTAGDLRQGITATNRAGVQITGTLNVENIFIATATTDSLNWDTATITFDQTYAELSGALLDGLNVILNVAYEDQSGIVWTFVCYYHELVSSEEDSISFQCIQNGSLIRSLVVWEEDGDIAYDKSAMNIPFAYTSNPKMDGTASSGSSTSYAKGDHIHPTDTSRQAKITANGILKGNGSGTITAAVGGTDYARMSDIPSVPSATTTTPKKDGTAAVGSETKWAKGDHVHPTDDTRQAKITASGILKGDGNGGVTAAIAGTDYQTPVAYITYCTFYKTENGVRVQTGISDAEVCVFDDTFSDIKDAYDAGRVVVMFGRDTYELALVGCSSTQIRFSMLASTQSMFTVAYNSTDTTKESTDINYIAIQKRIHQAGSLTSALEGMLKGVSDGSGGYKAAAATVGTDYDMPFVATGTLTAPGNDPVTATISTSFSAIYAAYTAGKRVILRMTNSMYKYELPLTTCHTSTIRFAAQLTSSRMIFINLSSADVVTVTANDISLVNANGVGF